MDTNFNKHVKKSPPLDLILSQMSPVLIISSCTLKAHYNIILPSMSSHYMYTLTPFQYYIN
jgi:hypothetical protein